MDKTNHKSNNIDFLRLFFSLCVLFSHSYPLGYGTEVGEPLFDYSLKQTSFGAIAVDAFFFLSGYLITQSWERSRSAGSFLFKRASRIYPGYLAAVAFCLWVVIPIAGPEGWRAYSWKTVADNIWPVITFQGFTGPEAFLNVPAKGGVNGSLWSISFEVWCYLGVMILGLTTLIRYRRLMIALFACTVIGSFLFEFFDVKYGFHIGWLIGYPRIWSRLLPFYMAGLVAYQNREVLRPRRGLALVAFIGLAIAAKLPYGMVLTLPTLGAYFLMYLSFTNDYRLHNVARYGDFSYGIYLYAFPIQQLVMWKLGGTTHPLNLFFLALVPTVVAGALSWHLVEKWFLRKSSAPPREPAFDSVPSVSTGVSTGLIVSNDVV